MSFELEIGEHPTRDGTVVHIVHNNQNEEYIWSGWFISTHGGISCGTWRTDGRNHAMQKSALDILPPEETYWMAWYARDMDPLLLGKYTSQNEAKLSRREATHYIQFAIRDGVPVIIDTVEVET